jgi:hypothetical protein
MKKLFYGGLMLAAITVFTAIGCKKETASTSTSTTDNSAANVTDNANDESEISNESNRTMDDANVAVNMSSYSGKRLAAGAGFGCSVTVDTSDKVDRKIVLHYDGSLCLKDGRKRSGSITIQLTGATKWKEPNATLTMTFDNYTVTKPNGKAYVINGTHSVTNQSGGLAWSSSAPVVHIISGTLNITFDNDNTSRSWTVSRKITYSTTNDVRYIQVESSQANDIVIQGVNRHGEDFTATITTPLQANDNCGWNRPTAGVRTVSSASAKDLTLSFGFDKDGNAVTTGCSDYFKATYSYNGVSKTLLLPY